MTRLSRHVALAILILPIAARPQAYDMSRPPALTVPARLVVPPVAPFTLPNGVQVRVVEQHELPLVQVTVNVAGGSRLDGAQSGLASFMANMLDEGAAGKDAAALQSAVAYLGASLSTNADWDCVVVSLKVPVRNLAPALDLMSEVVLRPAFSAAEVRRQRDLRLTNLLQLRDQPNALADLAFNQIVFPEGHPYHHSAAGDSLSTARLDSTGVRAFYDGAMRPERATIVIVGDIGAAQARTLLTPRFGAWRSTGQAILVSNTVSAPLQQAATHLYLVDKPAAAQSVITIGWPGVARTSPDYAALTVMNTVLGGSFTSRLNMNLREKKGYSYGASSRFAWRVFPGPFVASSAVRTNVTDSSLVEFFKELRTIRDVPLTSDELARAKAYVELGLPQSLESTSQVAGQMSQLHVFGLTLAELPRFARAVRAVTIADVQRVARHYLTPENATVVVVGDLAKIRAAVDALHLGSSTVLETTNVAK